MISRIEDGSITLPAARRMTPGITIRGHNKAESATVHVSSNGAIASFTGSGHRSTLKGDVNSTPREYVARWLEGIVKELAKAYLLHFLARHRRRRSRLPAE